MTSFQKVVIAIGVVPVLVLLIAFMLPDEFTVQRSIEIDGSPATIFPLISDLRAWENWSALPEKDSTLEYSYEEQTMGIGAKQSWNGAIAGEGLLELTGSDPRKGVVYIMTTGEGKLKMNGSIQFKRQDNTKLKIVWANTVKLDGNPLMRYLGLFMDSSLGPDYEKGLKNLQKLVQDT